MNKKAGSLQLVAFKKKQFKDILYAIVITAKKEEAYVDKKIHLGYSHIYANRNALFTHFLPGECSCIDSG